MNRDNELLQRFIEDDAQDAFASLVREKINLVYAAALRQVGGDSHLAQDVTQGVFVALACNAGQLKHHPVLTGWLFSTTRNIAYKTMRTHQRWHRRESEAIAVEAAVRQESVAWHELAPVIDEAMYDLAEKDRAALLLRFFEGKSHAEVGAAFGIAENAARMRIERALEKLRSSLSQRGITSTAAAVAAALAAQPALALPAGLTATVTGAALSSAGALAVAAVGPAATATIGLMTTTKLAIGTAAAIAVFTAGALVGRQVLAPPPLRAAAGSATPSADEISRLRTENERLNAEVVRRQAATVPASGRADIARGSGPAPRAALGQSVGFAGTLPQLPADAISSVTGKWQLLAELQRHKVIQARLALVDGAGNLNDAAANLFDLAPAEHETIKQAIDRARQRMEVLERENATVTRNDNGGYVISLAPFPEAGGQVYDELTGAIAGTLGPARNAAFAALAADQVDKAFAQFGATKRTVTVSIDPTNTKFGPYSYSDEQFAKGNHSRSSSNARTRGELMDRLGTIAKLLPPDF